jgi:hypothetical protein
MTLRNFGLPFSRRIARPNAGVSWRPVLGAVLVGIVLTLVWRGRRGERRRATSYNEFAPHFAQSRYSFREFRNVELGIPRLAV